MSDRIPESPFSRPNYRHDLELAMMARAAYASRDQIIGSMTGVLDSRDKEFTVPMNWELLNRESENFIDLNDDTGFVATAFKHQAEKHIVIAFRGSDNLKDWDINGPNVLLGADGDLLADQVRFGPFRFGEHPREQISKLQEKLLPNGDQQFRQFAQALEYVIHIQKRHPDYEIEVTGHSLGGSLAQVSSHTFGLGGRAFDPAGAENIIESEMYRKWLKEHNMAPKRVPVSDNPSWETSFVNYNVNESIPSHRTGQHLGGDDSLQAITALGGRQGAQDYVSYGLSKGSSIIGKVAGGSALLKMYNRAALEAQDVTEKHSMDRIIRVFEHALSKESFRNGGKHNHMMSINTEEPQMLIRTQRPVL